MFFSLWKENVSNKTWNQILIKTQIFRVKNHSNNAQREFRSLSVSQPTQQTLHSGNTK